jgi:ribonuclease HII
MPKRALTISEIKAEIVGGTLDDVALRRLTKNRRAGVRELARRELKRRASSVAEAARLELLLAFERPLWARGIVHVAGVDEVGMGPLAGPVVAAAVILKPDTSLAGIDDSKKLSPEERDDLAPRIREAALAWAIGVCSVEEIETLNIYRAGCEAMRRAVFALGTAPEHLLVDARRVPGVEAAQTPIIGGDAKSQSIAAASILAKVHRDALMTELARAHPGYGFDKHKGYATAEHREAIMKLGPSAVHRRAFLSGIVPSADPQLALALD